MQILRSILLSLPLLAAIAATTATAATAQGSTPPCNPCIGLHIVDTEAAAQALAQLPKVAQEGRLYLAFDAAVDADRSAVAQQVAQLHAAGATPWLRLLFTTPAPVADHLSELEAELRAATQLVRDAGQVTHFQILWQPADNTASPLDPAQYAFLFKRAAVAVSGARAEARVLTAPLPATEEAVATFYASEVAAYLDGVALTARELDLAALAPHLSQLDPGRPVIVEGTPFPEPASLTLAAAAELAREGAAIAFFDLDQPTASQLRPLVTMANEFHGELSFDPYSLPSGADGSWSFVRGSDLGLRVVVRAPASGDKLRLTFSDSQLRHPEKIDLESGEAIALFGIRKTAEGFELTLDNPQPVTLLRLERASAEQLSGLSEEVTIASQRQIPVEEIVRRLQTFDDAQQRKLRRYQATNTTHLRFQPSTGLDTVEVSFEGDFFFHQGVGSEPSGYDWAWQSLYINGVRWKNKTLPEIPLIQPEKAASMPLDIELTKRYSYRLRGSAVVNERDCWVVEFRPDGELAEKEKLFRGTVWVDKELFARVQTRAIQLGLEGEVLSNEETVTFQPLGADGQPAAWSAESYFLPVRTVAQQLLSVLNTTVVVEREVDLTNLRLNPEDFDQQLAATLASDSTMVRDSEVGLKYLVKKEGQEGRVEQEGFDSKKLFLVGGVFYDDALDFPLPLAGLNYFSFGQEPGDNQFNVFFAGALLTVDYAEPSLFGSKWDAGFDLFAVALPFDDSQYRDGKEIQREEVDSLSGNFSLLLGRPIGQFFKVNLEYEATFVNYGDTSNTDDSFILPQDNVTQSFKTRLSYNRAGYGLSLSGSFNSRSDWEFWGLPGNTEFDPDQEDYLLWQAKASKTWYLPKFRRFSSELNYFGGQDLDRFSKYQFGSFADIRIHGYQTDRVRAEDGFATHVSYGLGVGEGFRLEGVVDMAVVNDKIGALDNEFLAGAGIVGQFFGPWSTIVRLDLGVPVAGPDDGFTVNLVFLKLFN